jgi:hypothetical protein
MKEFILTIGLIMVFVIANSQTVKLCQAGELKVGPYEKVIEIIPKNEEVTIIYEARSGFFKVKYKEKEGFIHSDAFCKEEMELYSFAKNGSYKDCDAYINHYPKGKHIIEIKNLRKSKYIKEEEESYSLAKNGTKVNCENYIKEFPKSKYVIDIQNRLKTLNFKITSILPFNKQCSTKLPDLMCKNGAVGGRTEDGILIQFIQANPGGFISNGLPYFGSGIFLVMFSSKGAYAKYDPPANTVYCFIGEITVNICKEFGESVKIESNNGIYFKLIENEGLIYLKGEGKVTEHYVVTELPIKSK